MDEPTMQDLLTTLEVCRRHLPQLAERLDAIAVLVQAAAAQQPADHQQEPADTRKPYTTPTLTRVTLTDD